MSHLSKKLLFETPLGGFSIGLDADSAPATADYFERLASGGLLDDTSIFRIVNSKNNCFNPACPIHVIQGGLTEKSRKVLPRIVHESTQITGITHKKWTVSAARLGVGETYGSFFITMRDEPALDFGGKRHPDGQGFAAFGAVTSGYASLERIFLRAEPQEYLRDPIRITKVTVE